MDINSINENNQADIRQFGQNIPIISPAMQNQQEVSDLLEISASFNKIQPQMNFFQLLRIDEMVKRFKDKLISKAYIFSQRQKVIISKCYEEKYLQFKQEQQEFQNQVFDPSSKFFILLNITKTLISSLLLWLLPYLWSFTVLGDLDLDEVCLLSILFFLTDIIIKLNTAIIEKGNIIYSRAQILQYYARSQLPYDVILIFGLLVLMYLQNAGTIMILPVTIIIGFKFQECLDYLNEAINFNPFWREIINLFRLLIQINFFAHVIACVWYFVGNNTDYLEKTWILKHGIQNDSHLIKYCHSYYFATLTMVTVGYGDITPTNYIEVLCCIVIMFIACGMFGYCLSRIGQIISNINDSRANYELNLRIITKYMKQHQIPSSLQNRVQNYLEYISTQEEKEETESIMKITNSLSSNLRNELMYTIFRSLFRNNDCLIKQFSEQTLFKLALKIKQVNYCPAECIFKQDSIDDQSIYFIYEGQVQLLQECKQKPIYTLTTGDSFGEISFFTEQPRQTSAISVGFSKIYKIDRQSFFELISLEEREQFQDIKERLFQVILCYACKEKGHIFSTCPYLHYHPDIERMILKDNRQKQDRAKYKRKRMRFRTLINLNMTKQIQMQYNEQLEKIEELSETINSAESVSELSPTPFVRSSIEKGVSIEKAISNEKPCSNEESQFSGNIESKHKMPVTSLQDIYVSQIRIQQQQQQQQQQQPQQQQQQQLQVVRKSNKMISYLKDPTSLIIKQLSFQHSLKTQWIDDLDKQFDFKQYQMHNNLSTLLRTLNKRRKSKHKQQKNNNYSLFNPFIQRPKKISVLN